jgi:hypothetical protein
MFVSTLSASNRPAPSWRRFVPAQIDLLELFSIPLRSLPSGLWFDPVRE